MNEASGMALPVEQALADHVVQLDRSSYKTDRIEPTPVLLVKHGIQMRSAIPRVLQPQAMDTTSVHTKTQSYPPSLLINRTGQRQSLPNLPLLLNSGQSLEKSNLKDRAMSEASSVRFVQQTVSAKLNSPLSGVTTTQAHSAMNVSSLKSSCKMVPSSFPAVAGRQTSSLISKLYPWTGGQNPTTNTQTFVFKQQTTNPNVSSVQTHQILPSWSLTAKQTKMPVCSSSASTTLTTTGIAQQTRTLKVSAASSIAHSTVIYPNRSGSSLGPFVLVPVRMNAPISQQVMLSKHVAIGSAISTTTPIVVSGLSDGFTTKPLGGPGQLVTYTRSTDSTNTTVSHSVLTAGTPVNPLTSLKTVNLTPLPLVGTGLLPLSVAPMQQQTRMVGSPNMNASTIITRQTVPVAMSNATSTMNISNIVTGNLRPRCTSSPLTTNIPQLSLNSASMTNFPVGTQFRIVPTASGKGVSLQPYNVQLASVTGLTSAAVCVSSQGNTTATSTSAIQTTSTSSLLMTTPVYMMSSIAPTQLSTHFSKAQMLMNSQTFQTSVSSAQTGLVNTQMKTPAPLPKRSQIVSSNLNHNQASKAEFVDAVVEEGSRRKIETSTREAIRVFLGSHSNNVTSYDKTMLTVSKSVLASSSNLAPRMQVTFGRCGGETRNFCEKEFQSSETKSSTLNQVQHLPNTRDMEQKNGTYNAVRHRNSIIMSRVEGNLKCKSMTDENREIHDEAKIKMTSLSNEVKELMKICKPCRVLVKKYPFRKCGTKLSVKVKTALWQERFLNCSKKCKISFLNRYFKRKKEHLLPEKIWINMIKEKLWIKLLPENCPIETQDLSSQRINSTDHVSLLQRPLCFAEGVHVSASCVHQVQTSASTPGNDQSVTNASTTTTTVRQPAVVLPRVLRIPVSPADVVKLKPSLVRKNSSEHQVQAIETQTSQKNLADKSVMVQIPNSKYFVLKPNVSDATSSWQKDPRGTRPVHQPEIQLSTSCALSLSSKQQPVSTIVGTTPYTLTCVDGRYVLNKVQSTHKSSNHAAQQNSLIINHKAVLNVPVSNQITPKSCISQITGPSNAESTAHVLSTTSTMQNMCYVAPLNLGVPSSNCPIPVESKEIGVVASTNETNRVRVANLSSVSSLPLVRVKQEPVETSKETLLPVVKVKNEPVTSGYGDESEIASGCATVKTEPVDIGYRDMNKSVTESTADRDAESTAPTSESWKRRLIEDLAGQCPSMKVRRLNTSSDTLSSCSSSTAFHSAFNLNQRDIPKHEKISHLKAKLKEKLDTLNKIKESSDLFKK